MLDCRPHRFVCASDPFVDIKAVIDKHTNGDGSIWFHVDGAWGGSVCFSKEVTAARDCSGMQAVYHLPSWRPLSCRKTLPAACLRVLCSDAANDRACCASEWLPDDRGGACRLTRVELPERAGRACLLRSTGTAPYTVVI